MFAPHLGHFFFVGGDPDGSTLFVLDIHWQFRPQRLPQLLRVSRQGKLRLGIVHDDDVPHPSCAGAATHHLSFHNRNPQSALCTLIRTSRAYDSSANNHYVKSFAAHVSNSRANHTSLFDLSRIRRLV